MAAVVRPALTDGGFKTDGTRTYDKEEKKKKMGYYLGKIFSVIVST